MKFRFSLLFLLLTFSNFQNLYSVPYIQKDLTPIVNHLKPISLTEAQSGLDQIDCIYLINLDHRPERWFRSKIFFRQWGCFINRVSAVNGWGIPQHQLDELRGPYDLKMNGGAVGCLLSHVSIYRDAYERGFSNIWICEDDIEFCGNIQEIPRIIKDLSKIDPDWDLLYTDNIIGGCGKQWPRPGQPKYNRMKKGIKVGENIARVHGRFQTHSMIFSKKGIEKVLNYFSHVYIWAPIDIDLHYVPGIREYSVRENIVSFIKETPYSDTENN